MTLQPPPQPPYKGIGLEDVRKVLDSKLVNTGVPGAIAGFGISRAFEGEWWQFGSLLGAATGVWFLIKLGNRFAPKVERVIERADQAFDRQVDLALVNRSNFHQQYLEALKTHCHNLKVEGYKGRLPRLVLEEVYVPLRMNAGTRQTSLEQYRSRPIWDFLPKAQDRTFPERLLAVIADPGYGKTTLMRFLTLSFSTQGYGAQGAKELIPILLLFREFYSRIQSQTQPSLSQLIVEEVQNLPRCAELRTSEPWFKDQLQQGKCLVMLDGLDEGRMQRLGE
jgi:predicted NACHT family NTPase